ncbi:MAG: magnesium transporter [Candidatus Omnitrophica bacterium]|nr:magnesium transporter [Candidatus Omnitrophota bacterium]
MSTTMSKTTSRSLPVSYDYVAVSSQETVASTIELLRNRRSDFQSKITYLYVVNGLKKLIGVLRVRDLLSEEPSRMIHDIMQKEVLRVDRTSSIEEVLKIFKTHSFHAIPVTDQESRLVGTIHETALRKYLNPQEMRRLHRWIGFNPEEVEGNDALQIVFKRLPWLLISVTSGLVCAYILGLFIGRIESIVALVLFVPIILGLAGSVGTQSAHITNRELECGNLSIKNSFRILIREFIAALALGGVAFLTAAFIALVWRKPPVEGIALGFSIVAVMAASGILGAILPVVFRILRIPSSFASGLFLLFICDTFALILYFTISLSLLNPTLEIG